MEDNLKEKISCRSAADADRDKRCVFASAPIQQVPYYSQCYRQDDGRIR